MDENNCINKGQVLLLGEEDRFSEVLSVALGFYGLDVESASTQDEITDLSRQQEFDLVITDLDMPDMERLKLVNKLVGEKKAPPVIVISGYPPQWEPLNGDSISFGLKKAGLEGKKVRLLPKPFMLEDLFGLIEECLDEKESNDEPVSLNTWEKEEGR